MKKKLRTMKGVGIEFLFCWCSGAGLPRLVSIGRVMYTELAKKRGMSGTKRACDYMGDTDLAESACGRRSDRLLTRPLEGFEFATQGVPSIEEYYR